MGTPLYTVAQLRAIEQAAMAGLPSNALMQRAGAAAARLALQLLGGPEARVLAIAGPGNNGGDAIEAALQLCEAGIDAHVLLCIDPDQLHGDAATAFQRASQASVPMHSGDQADALLAQAWDVLLDGLFGIGLARPITGPLAAIVEQINRRGAPVLSLDIPSGLDANTGTVVGPEGCAVQASHTITFIGDKPGLHTAAARDHAGEVHVADLGIAAALFPPSQASLVSVDDFAGQLHARRHDSHKGSFGNVIVLGGGVGMTGAPVLGARAALHCGAGRVYIGFVGPGLPADSGQPELMCRDAAGMEFGRAVLVAGPGMGDQPEAVRQLSRALSHEVPLVLDADGLNLVAAEPGLRARLAARRAATILTPHPLEAARLLGSAIGSVQHDRVGAARELAAALKAIVVLKGSGTVIARPDGQAAINPTGNPALATAGSGDVLAGIIGALLAQGLPAWEASLCAVWLHGAAADELVRQGTGPVGVVASELVLPARLLLNQLVLRDRALAAPGGPRQS